MIYRQELCFIIFFKDKNATTLLEVSTTMIVPYEADRYEILNSYYEFHCMLRANYRFYLFQLQVDGGTGYFPGLNYFYIMHFTVYTLKKCVNSIFSSWSLVFSTQLLLKGPEFAFKSVLYFIEHELQIYNRYSNFYTLYMIFWRVPTLLHRLSKYFLLFRFLA